MTTNPTRDHDCLVNVHFGIQNDYLYSNAQRFFFDRLAAKND